MPGLQPVAFVRWARAHYPATEVLPLTAHDRDCYLAGMVEAGAVGCLLKAEAPETIVAAVRAAVRGEGYFSPAVAAKVAEWMQGKQPGGLTERELEVLRLVAKGLSNKEIAGQLGVKERTVEFT